MLLPNDGHPMGGGGHQTFYTLQAVTWVGLNSGQASQGLGNHDAWDKQRVRDSNQVLPQILCNEGKSAMASVPGVDIHVPPPNIGDRQSRASVPCLDAFWAARHRI